MNNPVEKYIEKQPSPQKEICTAVRDLIYKTFPGVKEAMKWGVPAFANGTYYIVALKDHVNLGFTKDGLTKEELKLFDGQANTMVRVEIASVVGIDEKRIVGLLKLVDERFGGR